MNSNWVDIYREVYIALSGLMIGVFLAVGYYRIHQPTRWAKGFFFVIVALVGFMILAMMGFAAHLGDPSAPWRIYLYPLPLLSLAIGTWLINTSELSIHNAVESKSRTD